MTNNKRIILTNPTFEEVWETINNVSIDGYRIGGVDTFVTHSGTFHAHEIVAAVLLDPKLIIRTRNEKIIESLLQFGAYVNDVGKDYSFLKNDEGSNLRGLDHHVCNKETIDWHIENKRLLELMFHGINVNYANGRFFYRMEDFDMTNYGGQYLYDMLMSVALIDNGRSCQDIISRELSDFNPCWDEDQSDEAYSRAFDDAFECACVYIQNATSKVKSMDRKVRREVAKIKARSAIQDAMAAAIKSNNPNVIILDTFAPWQEYVIESNIELNTEFDFVVYPELGSTINWKAQAVPVDQDSFVNRVNLLLQEELEDCIFVHKEGKFVGSFTSKEAAIKAVEKSLLVNKK